MIETVTFPVADCPVCKKEVLLAQTLDADDELIYACSHCNHLMPADLEPRRLGPASLAIRGYVVDGETEQGGCGSGSSCSC